MECYCRPRFREPDTVVSRQAGFEARWRRRRRGAESSPHEAVAEYCLYKRQPLLVAVRTRVDMILCLWIQESGSVIVPVRWGQMEYLQVIVDVVALFLGSFPGS